MGEEQRQFGVVYGPYVPTSKGSCALNIQEIDFSHWWMYVILNFTNFYMLQVLLFLI